MFSRDKDAPAEAMINTADMQNAYIDLYKELRRYIWGYDVVEAIANLEIATYQTCPDMDVIKSRYNELEYLVKYVANDDEDLREALDDFNEVLNSGHTTYTLLRQVNEVI